MQQVNSVLMIPHNWKYKVIGKISWAPPPLGLMKSVYFISAQHVVLHVENFFGFACSQCDLYPWAGLVNPLRISQNEYQSYIDISSPIHCITHAKWRPHYHIHIRVIKIGYIILNLWDDKSHHYFATDGCRMIAYLTFAATAKGKFDIPNRRRMSRMELSVPKF